MQKNLQRVPAEETNRPVKRRGKGRLAWVVLILLAAAALLYLGCTHQIGPFTPEEPERILYRGMLLDAAVGVPVNAYPQDGFATDDRGRVHFEWEGRQAKEGIDVSFYQGEIDWEAVAADGVDFAMIRLGYRGYTQGGLALDSYFTRNIQGALDAGLEVGVYFFSQAITPEEAEEEAQFVLDNLQGYDIRYPVVFDWEPILPQSNARTDEMDPQLLTQCAAAFCAVIQQAGYDPMIYLNQDMGYLTFDLAQLTDYPLWLAEYDTSPDFYYHFDLWQYTHSGTVDGIQGSVDWNLDLRGVLR
jgi:GH25 family lysozyme M1 (1,4-beta-N-acetylmuramidase)